jgi:two-component system nitrogen regulation response regulator NtrX
MREFKETIERKFLVDKLRENGWDIVRTAQAIGTPRNNLHRKFEHYRISPENDELGVSG